MNRAVRFVLVLMAGIASRIIPRSKNVWVFGGNKGLRFADNSMYFFKYCSEHTSKKVIWLARSSDVVKQIRDQGFRAFKTNRLAGLYYGFRAKWHIFDVHINDTNSFSSRGARQLNLWHGYPIKDFRNFGIKSKNEDNGFLRQAWNLASNANNGYSRNYFLHQNKKYLWQITEAFDVNADNVIIANYPRNIVFEKSNQASSYVSKNAKPWIEKLQQIRKDGNRVLGYFPTWRGNQTDSFMGTRNVEEIRALNEFLADNKLVIATKWHSCVFDAYGHNGQCSAAEDLNTAMNSLSNVVVLGFDQDLNSLLGQCDVLISDYSGVIVDYLLSDRPQVFMAYDLEEYRKEYGFVFDYEEFIPGPMAKTLDELMPILADYARDPAAFSRQFEEHRARLVEDLFDDLQGSARIIEFIRSVP